MEYRKSLDKVIQPTSLKEYEDHKKMISLLRRVGALEERLAYLDSLNKDKEEVPHGN